MEQRYKRAIVEKKNHTVSEKETQETSRTEKYWENVKDLSQRRKRRDGEGKGLC